MLREQAVLIVEDDPLLAEQIKQSLQKEGYTISGSASNLEDAVRIIKNNKTDLALVDIHLDGPEDGIATAKELLKIKWIPIIYITGDSMAESVERSKSTFPAAFLEKPLRINEMCVQIELALHNFQDKKQPSPAPSTSDHVFVLSDKNYIRIKQSEILFLQADRIYCRLFLTKKGFERVYPKTSYRPIHISMSMGHIFRQLPDHFYRLSRSLVVNLELVDRIGTTFLILEDHEIAIPEGSRNALMARLGVIKVR